MYTEFINRYKAKNMKTKKERPLSMPFIQRLNKAKAEVKTLRNSTFYLSTLKRILLKYNIDEFHLNEILFGNSE